MKRFEGKPVLVAVTAGIAAYKACEVIRVLQKEGAVVQTMMTPDTEAFIGRLTLESLTRRPVLVEHLENTLDGTPTHIAMAQQMDALVIVPCTANTLGKIACGMADNLVTTTALTFTNKPVVIAPAMNTRMWENPRVEANVKHLYQDPFVTIIDPVSGDLACGESGDGKLASVERIVDGVYQALHPYGGLYKGQRILVTAGGTAEAIDPVRLLTNRSSGKMGVALADELWAMGAEVTLVHTLGVLDKPYSCIAVESAEQMARVVFEQAPHQSGIIMAAAVSDFIPAVLAPQKIKKCETLTLDLVKGVDILATLGQQKRPGQWLVGFAAESEDGLAHASDKLQRKNLDMIVLNDISRADIGFGSEDNAVTLLFPKHPPTSIEKAPKRLIARKVLMALTQKLSQSRLIQS